MLTFSHDGESKPLAMSRLFARADHLVAIKKTLGSQPIENCYLHPAHYRLPRSCRNGPEVYLSRACVYSGHFFSDDELQLYC